MRFEEGVVVYLDLGFCLVLGFVVIIGTFWGGGF